MYDPHGAKCDDLRDVIQDIDEGFDVAFDWEHGLYRISHNDIPFQSFPPHELGKGIIDHLKHITYLNKNGLVLQHLDEVNLKEELAEDKKVSEMAESMASDIIFATRRDHTI